MPKSVGAQGGGFSLASALIQLVLLFLAVRYWQVSAIQPLKLLVVLLHEMSHGLMALATGGRVHDIVVTPAEGGSCESSGGNAVLIAAAGYLGSIFFGGMILRASRDRGSAAAAFALLTLLLLGAACTVLHDSYSRTFAFSLAATFMLVGIVAPGIFGGLFLRATGTVSCLYALFDIYGDILATRPEPGGVENDAETFSSLTGMPVQLVGASWLLISLLFFVAVLRSSVVHPARAASASSSSRTPAEAQAA